MTSRASGRVHARPLVAATAFLIAIVAASLPACIIRRDAPDPTQALVGKANDIPGAVIFAGTGLAGAVANRAITGDCYSTCPYGMLCDRATGACVTPACNCPADLVCESVGRDVVCVQPSPMRDREALDAGDNGGPSRDASDGAVD